MPANKYALLRYRIIDKCIRNKYRPFPTKEDLRQACEDELYHSSGDRVSISTIDKDLYAMRNDELLGYMAPIKFSKVDKGYVYTDENYSIDKIPLNEDDIEAIRLAASTLNQFKGNPVFSSFNNAIEKIFERVNISEDLSDDAISNFVQFETSNELRGSEFLIDLLEAIKNRFEVEFEYQKFNETLPKKYCVKPLLLKEYRNRWYLIGKDEKVKTFGLDRTINLKVTDRYFKKIFDFNPELYFSKSIGITALDESASEVVLEFDNSQKGYITSQPIHSSQQIFSESDTNFKISIEVLITFELISTILSFGSKVKVESPSSLINKVKSEIQLGFKNY